MTEAQLQAAIVELCGWLRLRYYHPYDSRRSVPGFPDLTITGRQVLFRELKSPSGRLTAEQAAWKRSLLAAGADWGLWRPSDWLDGTILRELQANTKTTGGTQGFIDFAQLPESDKAGVLMHRIQPARPQ
jgi:hypothetical protein